MPSFANTRFDPDKLTVEGWPVSGRVTGIFAQKDDFWRGRSPHSGVDIAAVRGTSVYAPADAIYKPCPRGGGFGIWVMLDHGDGHWTAYAHLDERLDAGWGTKLKAGDKIGIVGLTGFTTGAHLHWGMSTTQAFMPVRAGHTLVNPLDFIPPQARVIEVEPKKVVIPTTDTPTVDLPKRPRGVILAEIRGLLNEIDRLGD